MKAEASTSTPTREITLSILLKRGERSASYLASLLGISVQAMRRHLRNLAQDGLVQSNLMRSGPGRPSNLWRLTKQGESTFNKGNELFSLELLDTINRTFSNESLEKVLEEHAIKKADLYRKHIGQGSLKERVEKLLKLRESEGYLGECQSDPEGRGWYINEFHCSIRDAAEKYPMICDKELNLIRLTFPDCEVIRTHWRLELDHYCGFHIIPSTNH